MRPDWDFRHFRYLLVTTRDPALGQALALGIEDEARLVATQGEWFLYESKLPIAPIDEPEAPLPRDAGPTVMEKLVELSKRFGGPEPVRPTSPPAGVLPEANTP